MTSTDKQQREREKIRARRANRATYDLPPEVRAAVRDLAEEQKLPASQLVTLALLRFLREYHQGEIALGAYKHPSRSPRYDWNLVFPADLLKGALKDDASSDGEPAPRRKRGGKRESQ